jgi:hypothetical protein
LSINNIIEFNKTNQNKGLNGFYFKNILKLAKNYYICFFEYRDMDYNNLCKSILDLDSKIRFAGICDESGEIKHGGQKEGVENILSNEETRKSNLQALARWGLRNSLSSKIGRGKYAMAEYEKIKRITIPLDDDHLLLITTEVEADHEQIINNTLKLLSASS